MTSQTGLPSVLIGRARSTKGQAIVEFTLGFILFYMILMAIIEFSHLLYAQVTLQHALGTAGRYMIIGRTGTDRSGAAIPRDEMIHGMFCANVIAAGVRCPDIGPNFQFACLDAACKQPGGGPDQVVLVSVNVWKPTLMPFFSQFFPNGGVPLRLSTTWKNEPFSTS